MSEIYHGVTHDAVFNPVAYGLRAGKEKRGGNYTLYKGGDQKVLMYSPSNSMCNTITGVVTTYYPKTSGLNEKIKYQYDLENGSYQKYSPHGSLLEKGQYSFGHRVGRWVEYAEVVERIGGFENVKTVKKSEGYYNEQGKSYGAHVSYKGNGYQHIDSVCYFNAQGEKVDSQTVTADTAKFVLENLKIDQGRLTLNDSAQKSLEIELTDDGTNEISNYVIFKSGGSSSKMTQLQARTILTDFKLSGTGVIYKPYFDSEFDPQNIFEKTLNFFKNLSQKLTGRSWERDAHNLPSSTTKPAVN